MRTINGLFVLFVSGPDTELVSFCSDLEKAVEDLSELLESPIEAENIPTLRQKVTDKTVCVLVPGRVMTPFLSRS